MKSYKLSQFLIRCAIFSAFLAPLLHSQEMEYEVKVKYPEKNPHVTITVVVSKEHKADINYFKNLAIESVRIVEDIFKIQYRDDFSIVFDSRFDYHNGLTTVIPSNRVYVYTEVPNLESSIGLVK